MIKDVKAALATHGLNLNIDECLIQTNCPTAAIQPITVDGQAIPMVSASPGFKVLGTQFTLQGKCSAELECRMSAAWGKFHSLWSWQKRWQPHQEAASIRRKCISNSLVVF